MSPDEMRVQKMTEAVDSAIIQIYNYIPRLARESLIRDFCAGIERCQHDYDRLLTQSPPVKEIPVRVIGQAIAERRRAS